MDVLVTVLARNGAVITPAEQQEPEALLEAMHMPTAKLRQPTVIPRAKPDDLIRTTVDVPSHIGERTIPAGSQGLVLEANLSGSACE